MKSKVFTVGLVAALCLGPWARADETSKAAVGDKAPAFSLQDLDGQTHTLEQHTREGKVVVLEWFDPTCPFVKKHHVKFDTMKEMRDNYGDKVVWLAVNSSNQEVKERDAFLQENKRARDELRIDYPVLLDADGQVGRAYGATHSSQVFVIDAKGTLAYSGAIDDDPSAENRGSTNHLEAALDAALEGKPVQTPTTRPYGCPIKYAPQGQQDQLPPGQTPGERPPTAGEDEARPDGMGPDQGGTSPDGTTPDGTTPDDGSATPDGMTPDDGSAAPEGSTPDGTTPDEGMAPDGTQGGEGTEPEGTQGEGSTPGEAPDGSQGGESEGMTPDGGSSGDQDAEGAAPEGGEREAHEGDPPADEEEKTDDETTPRRF